MPNLAAKSLSIAAIQRIAGALFVIAILCPKPSQAEYWTRFRGPNGTGLAAEHTFLAQWSDQDYLWKIELPGVGHSSPVGWENQLFITTGDAETGAVTLHCFDSTTANELWDRDLPGEQYAMHASNSYASATPVVDQHHVYMTWATAGKMHCIAHTHQGKEIWRTELGQFAGPHGFAASPVIIDGVICVQVDHAEEGFLVGLDATTGDVRWRAKRPGGKASYATPCVWIADGGRPTAISQSMTGGMQAISVRTGEPIWEIVDAFPARTVSSPFLANDHLLIGVCGGGGTGKRLVGVQVTSSSPPLEQFSMSKQIPYVPTPLAVGNLLFLWHDQGKISCVDLESENPSKPLWTERIGGKFFGSPILAGDKIYCLSMEGNAIVIAADREYTLLGETDLGAPTNATPAVHQGRLYLRTESSLACLSAQQ